MATSPEVTGFPFLAVESSSISSIVGVPDDDLLVIQRLLKVWRDKYPRNLIRTQYVDAHERFKDFGISIPDRIKGRAEAMIGWPAKAVRSLSDLSVFEGFSFPSGVDDFEIGDLAEDNALDVNVSQAITSAYTHSCSFLTVYEDPEQLGRIVVMPRSADWSSAIWDRAKHRVAAALTITADNQYGQITAFSAWLPGKVYLCVKSDGGWAADVQETYYPRPTVVPFCYDAQLNRPFGRSRVSRPLMALTDIGFRTLVRMEASAEFYSVPKLWFLGADQDAFSSDTWSSLISAINAISKDEDGDKPALQQISQASMQPHSDMLKTIALMVASETNLPVNDLGITMDNPASAEAMAAAERKLSREADRQNKQFGRALKDAIVMAVTLRDGLEVVPAELKQIEPIWAPTRDVSDAARADSFSKIAGVEPAFAQSEVGWRYAGFTQRDIETILSAIRRGQAQSTLSQLIGGSRDDQSGRGTSGGGATAGDSTGEGGSATSVGGTEPDRPGAGAGSAA
jgi:hypothetical protein